MTTYDDDSAREALNRRAAAAPRTGQRAMLTAVWLGDLAGWTVWAQENRTGDAVYVEHRCGYGVTVVAPGNFLANIISDVVLPHRATGCAPRRPEGIER